MIEDKFAEAIGRAVRPVTFADDPNLPWGFGTAFMVEYLGEVYVVTARHVFENQQAEYQSFRYFLPGYRRAVPFNRCSTFTIKLPNSEDHSDMIFFQVDTRLHAASGGPNLSVIVLADQSFPASKVPDGADLFLAGYPAIDERYDYDTLQIRTHLLMKLGKKTESIFGDPIYQFSGDSSGFDFNGMSGSPVFTLYPDNRLNLIGVVIRGSSKSGVLNFIDASLLGAAIVNSTLEK